MEILFKSNRTFHLWAIMRDHISPTIFRSLKDDSNVRSIDIVFMMIFYAQCVPTLERVKIIKVPMLPAIEQNYNVYGRKYCYEIHTATAIHIIACDSFFIREHDDPFYDIEAYRYPFTFVPRKKHHQVLYHW